MKELMTQRIIYIMSQYGIYNSQDFRVERVDADNIKLIHKISKKEVNLRY